MGKYKGDNESDSDNDKKQKDKDKKEKKKDKKKPPMDNRDPRQINDFLTIEFEDVLAEPDGAHSIDCVWRLSYRCFTGSKNCCYRTLTLFCGWLMALVWGCEIACVTFIHVWQVTPALNMFAVNCGCLQKFWGTALQCFLAPICETMGLFFSRIQVSRYAALDEDHKRFLNYPN